MASLKKFKVCAILSPFGGGGTGRVEIEETVYAESKDVATIHIRRIAEAEKALIVSCSISETTSPGTAVVVATDPLADLVLREVKMPTKVGISASKAPCTYKEEYK